MGWTTPSTLATSGVPYTYDSNLVVSFPNNIKAPSLIGNVTGNADTATMVKDYNNNNANIKIGYNGAGLAVSDIKYIAGFTTGDSNSEARIKNISKENLKSWLNYTLGDIGAASSSHNHDSSYVKKSGDTMSGTLRVLENGIGSDLNNDGVSLANNSILLCSGGYEDYEYFQLGGTSQRPDIFIDRPGNPITLTSSLPRDENIPSEVPALSIRGNNLQNGFTFYIDKLIDP